MHNAEVFPARLSPHGDGEHRNPIRCYERITDEHPDGAGYGRAGLIHAFLEDAGKVIAVVHWDGPHPPMTERVSRREAHEVRLSTDRPPLAQRATALWDRPNVRS